MSADTIQNNPPTATHPISITASAIVQLKRILQEKNLPDDLGLRVGVRGGGCSGFEYQLGFDQAQEDDQQFTIEGIRVLLKPAHALYLLGMEIDWATGLDNRGFTFNNPNADSTCGCGSSFSA